MLGLKLKFENCLIQSKLRIQRHIIAEVDSSTISSPNLEELDSQKHSSTFSSVLNQLFANAIAQQAILPQAIGIWGSKSSLHLCIAYPDTQISAKNRIRMLRTIARSNNSSPSNFQNLFFS